MVKLNKRDLLPMFCAAALYNLVELNGPNDLLYNGVIVKNRFFLKSLKTPGNECLVEKYQFIFAVSNVDCDPVSPTQSLFPSPTPLIASKAPCTLILKGSGQNIIHFLPQHIAISHCRCEQLIPTMQSFYLFFCITGGSLQKYNWL